MAFLFSSFFCIVVFVSVLSISQCDNAHTHLKQANHLAARKINAEHEEGASHRYKRGTLEISGLTEEKRLRDFVGKRSQNDIYLTVPEVKQLQPLKEVPGNSKDIVETVRNDNEKPMYGFDFDENVNNENGLQEQFWDSLLLTEPSSPDSDSWRSYGKRLRDFVGKRGGMYLPEKRLRDFVGKRDSNSYEDFFRNEKRLRDFVGKRDYNSGTEFFETNKRLRDFVGKRTPSHDNGFVSKRLRDFVGKRESSDDLAANKRLRDFVGKRQGSEVFDEEKRLRDFVGKRQDSDVFGEEKRLRDFVGKRQEVKRLRDFVGKRGETEAAFSEDKRLRDFVGKRINEFVGTKFGLDADMGDTLTASKRLRDFVGKRNFLEHLETPSVDKRLRDFVGKR